MKLSLKTKELSFGSGACWKISAPAELSVLFRALPLLNLEQSILYIEAGAPAPAELDSFLKKRTVAENIRIAGGTLLPRPTIYRIPLTTENIEDIAKFARRFPTPVGSIHIHIYRDDEILLSSYDAFIDPIWVSKDVPESKIRNFAEAMQCSYEKKGKWVSPNS